MKQNSEVRFKCTSEELEKIKQKASSCGMTTKAFILYVCKNTTLKIVVS